MKYLNPRARIDALTQDNQVLKGIIQSLKAEIYCREDELEFAYERIDELENPKKPFVSRFVELWK